MSIDEHQVADVDDQSRCLSDDEHRIAAMDCVRGGDQPADDREIPELDRDVARAPALGGDPLHDETRPEDELAEEADHDPGVPTEHVWLPVAGSKLALTPLIRPSGTFSRREKDLD